jgi:hypothetical protein
MQQLLNSQKGSKASINIWLELSKYLNLFIDATRLGRMNARVMKQLLDALTEGMQGPCKETQHVLLQVRTTDLPASLQRVCREGPCDFPSLRLFEGVSTSAA